MQVTELITRAYIEANVISAEFETASEQQTSNALYLLNVCLSESQINGNFIPFETHTTITCVPGQQEYSLTDVVEVRQITFLDGDVRFNMICDSQYRFFGSMRVDEIRSLPFHYYVERCVGGSNLYLYFLPDQAYTLQLLVKKSITQLTIADNLDQFDLFFIDYLTHLLAQRLCIEAGQVFRSDLKDLMNKYETKMKQLTPLRLEGVPSCMFQGDSASDPYFYTYFRGWMP